MHKTRQAQIFRSQGPIELSFKTYNQKNSTKQKYIKSPRRRVCSRWKRLQLRMPRLQCSCKGICITLFFLSDKASRIFITCRWSYSVRHGGQTCRDGQNDSTKAVAKTGQKKICRVAVSVTMTTVVLIVIASFACCWESISLVRPDWQSIFRTFRICT